jgi:hypothetical protein
MERVQLRVWMVSAVEEVARQSTKFVLTFANAVEAGDEVVVADDGQPEERIDGDEDVDDKAPVLTDIGPHEGPGELFDGRRRAVLTSGPPRWVRVHRRRRRHVIIR